MNAFQQIAQQDQKAFQKVRRQFQRECREFPAEFKQIPIEEAKDLTHLGKAPEAIFRNRSFFVMLFMDDCDGTPFLRMTVNRTELDNDGGWKGDITWDELMAVKRGIGMEGHWMTEVYPPDEEIMNVANMRHLFAVNQPPFAWARKCETTPARQESILGKILSTFRN